MRHAAFVTAGTSDGREVKSTRSVARAVALLLLASAALAGCHKSDDFEPDAQFAPSLRPAFGARVDDGQLKIWTGSTCTGVTRLAILFDFPSKGNPQSELTSTSTSGATVDRFTVGTAPAGMKVKTPLPTGYDWQSAKTATLTLSGPPATWGSNVQLAEVKNGSASHPQDTYYFQGVGWLDQTQVSQQDGKTFLATCTPDPAKT